MTLSKLEYRRAGGGCMAEAVGPAAARSAQILVTVSVSSQVAVRTSVRSALEVQQVRLSL